MAEGGGEDEGQEKSFEPTQRRIDQAREKGDVPRSTDLNAAAAYLGLLGVIVASGGGMGTDLVEALAPFLGSADRLEGRLLAPGGLAVAGHLVGGAVWAIAPLFLVPAALVLASLLAQQAIVASSDKIMPKASRVNPIEVAKNKFGPTGLMEWLKSAVKMLLVSGAVWFWLIARIPDLVGLAASDARGLPRHLGDVMVSLLTVILLIAGSIAALDYLWQRYDHLRKLKMSYEELKKDSKETEGDPYLKQARRRRAEELATNRMLQDVPKADVVIVNPEHYAVALKWSRAKGAAPICVAKGVDAVAQAIRVRAMEAGVPIHRDPPTARAIHASVEIGREILEDHYRAVAAAIRYAEDMRKRARERAW
jgi:flagellar biosynthetic protein FlhB